MKKKIDFSSYSVIKATLKAGALLESCRFAPDEGDTVFIINGADAQRTRIKKAVPGFGHQINNAYPLANIK